jgi:flagellar assembly factor FliW
VLAIVMVAADWRNSTINLRAPLFVSVRTMRGTQVVLTDSVYRLDEALPPGYAGEAGG